MKPLIVLITAFAITLAINKIVLKSYNLAFSARIAMSVMLVFTAMGHFMYAKGMSMMIPDFIPFKVEMVYLTALIEILAAVGLLFPAYKQWVGWALILFFILILPANINAAVNQIDFQNASYNGKGIMYLWFRVPLQVSFIAWVYVSAVRN